MKTNLLLISSFVWGFNISLAADADDCDLVDTIQAEQNQAEQNAIQTEKNIEKENKANSRAKKPASQMRMSDEGLRKLATREGLRTKPYNDQNGKNITSYTKGATIGYGHLITSPQEFAKYKNGISKDEALRLYKKDLAKYEQSVSKTIKTDVTQSQYDAMVSLSYNIGPAAFANSSVAKMVNDPNAKTGYKDLGSAWKFWNKSQGKVMKGLNNRRNSEWEQFNN